MKRSRCPPTILVCEAYEGLQEAFRLILEDWASVRCVARAEDCFSQLTQGPVDLLIFDLDLQAVDPLGFLRDLRSVYPDLKVLLVAGEFEFDFQVAALKFSPVSFLTKPFNTQATVERIQVLVGYATSSVRTRVVRIALPSAAEGRLSAYDATRGAGSSDPASSSSDCE